MDPDECSSVVSEARKHKRSGALESLAASNLSMVSLLANALVMSLATHAAPSPTKQFTDDGTLDFTKCCSHCKGPVFYL